MADEKKNRCWPGYEPVKGKKPNSQGSCRKKAASKLKPSEQKFRAKREKQLKDWKEEHPKSPGKAAQHLAAPGSRKKAAAKPRARAAARKRSGK